MRKAQDTAQDAAQAEERSPRQQGETVDATTGVAKTPEPCAGQIHCCDNPLGHRAQGLESSVEPVALLVFSPSVRD